MQKMKKTIILCSALAILASAACNKSNSDSTTTPSLSGLSLSDTPPTYIKVGSTVTITADVSSLAASDGSKPTIGIFFQVNAAQKDTLTKDLSTYTGDISYTYKADTTGTYTVYCYAFAGSDYYSTSSTTTFNAIDPETVLDGTAADAEVTIGGITWKTANLNKSDMGLSFLKSPILDGVLGRLYNWEEAVTACPSGWHLPSMADFESCFGDTDGVITSGDLMANATFEGVYMWEYWPQVVITNKYGFNALPIGYVDILDNFTTYDHYGEYACWWTSDQDNGQGRFIYIYDEYKWARKALGDKKTLYMGVRCVKD